MQQLLLPATATATRSSPASIGLIIHTSRAHPATSPPSAGLHFQCRAGPRCSLQRWNLHPHLAVHHFHRPHHPHLRLFANYIHQVHLPHLQSSATPSQGFYSQVFIWIFPLDLHLPRGALPRRLLRYPSVSSWTTTTSSTTARPVHLDQPSTTPSTLQHGLYIPSFFSSQSHCRVAACTLKGVCSDGSVPLCGCECTTGCVSNIS